MYPFRVLSAPYPNGIRIRDGTIMQSAAMTSRDTQPADASRLAGKRSAAGRGASVSKVPVGNHGDNLQSDHHGQLSLFLEDAAEEAFNVRVSHERTAEAAYQREAQIVSLYAKHAGLSVEDVYGIFAARGQSERAE